MQNRRFFPLADAADERTHEYRRQTAATVRVVGAHRADLRVARRVETLAGHRDQIFTFTTHSDVRPELDRARQERSRPRPLHEIEHLGHVGVTQTSDRVAVEILVGAASARERRR